MSKGNGCGAQTDRKRPAPRKSLILTLWAEAQPGQPPVWRGCIETPDQQRYYFDRISGLRRLLEKLGWQDPPGPSGAGSPPA